MSKDWLAATNEDVDSFIEEIDLILQRNKLEFITMKKVHENELSILTKSIQDIKEKKEVVEVEELSLQAEKERTEEECNTLIRQLKQLQVGVNTKKEEISQLSCDPLSENDQEKLKKAKKKFVLYEKCSGVTFDYTVKATVNGFVGNAAAGYLHSFCIEKNSDIEKALWQEIKKAGALNCSKHPGMERNEFD